MNYFRNSRFWLSIVFGVSFGLLFNQYVLLKLWSFGSLRLQVASYFSILLFFIVCFWLLERILTHRFRLLVKIQRVGVIFVSAFLLPMILMVSVLNLEKLLSQSLYFFLPAHTVEIEVLPGEEQKQADVVLTAFFSEAQGYISFNALEAKGWQRIGDEFVLTDSIDNRIEWRGKTGDRAFLVFGSRSGSAQVTVTWDNAHRTYELSPRKARETRASKDFRVPLYADWPALILAIYLCIVFSSFAVSVLFAGFPGIAASAPLWKWSWLFHALPMCLVWSIYLLVFWPGFMSNDSMSQWGQVITGEFVHANPVGHTLTIWLITRLWFSPAAVALVQVAALGVTLGWGIATMREFGAPAWLAWLTTIALALSPANSALSITLWKDVLFSIVVVALTVLVFKIVATQGTWLNQKMSWLPLGSILTLVSLYRLNGIFVAAGTLLLVAWLYREYWRSLLKTAGLFVTIYFLFTGVVFRILDVQVVNMARDELILSHLLAGHMRAGTFIPREDQMLLRPAFPEYPWPYRCHRNTELIFTVDRSYLIKHGRAVADIALQVTQRNPWETLRHFACQGASVYRIPQEYPNELIWFGIVKNDYGIQASSLLPGLSPLLTDVLRWIIDPKNWRITQFVWRMPFWMYLSIFACIVFCARNKTWRPLLVLLPGLVTVLPYLILTLGQIFRYVYSMYLIGILLSGYFLFCVFPNGNLISDEESVT